MRSVSTTFVVLLLPILLVVTTPTGTGAGVHLGQLVQPLFAHVHIVNGRIVLHEGGQPEATSAERPAGVAFGAAAGANTAADGVSLVPALRLQVLLAPVQVERVAWFDPISVPRGVTEAPPDPPPTFAPER